MWRYVGLKFKVKDTSYRLLLCLFLYFVVYLNFFSFGIQNSLNLGFAFCMFEQNNDCILA